jgi:trimethylamine--corrinoid protein Co-methyltransferase
MQTEYLYPGLFNRMSPTDWADAGAPDPLDEAIRRKEELLRTHVPMHISDEVDRKVRDRFPIFLSREQTGRGA